MDRVGRNDRCSCGSGKKFKKCCESKGVGLSYSREDRTSAWTKLTHFIEDQLGAEDDLAFDEFWGPWADHPGELPEHFAEMSEHVQDLWFVFDRPLDDGRLVVDRFLEERQGALGAGEKLYLRALRASAMRLYEIEDLRPGESLTLRDVLEGARITVQERMGSRSLDRFECLAARVVQPGASGKPELEGLFEIPEPLRDRVRSALRQERDDYLGGIRGATVESFYKTAPPLFHEAWAGAILEPHVPRLANTDGEELVHSKVSFEVLDAAALELALDECAELARDAPSRGRWSWSGKNQKGSEVTLGTLQLEAGSLRLEANSVARGERGRALVERLAGAAIRHRATTHEDTQRAVREALKVGEPLARGEEPGIPPELQEALVLDQMARYYRTWLDEPLPALGGQTARAAAKKESLRPDLIELIHGLDRMYQRALRDGAPAYDPSWMWAELGLDDGAPPHPPPLAHERVAELVPGSGELCHAVAEALRKKPGFDDRSSVFTGEDLAANLELQRFLRGLSKPPGGEAGPPLGSYLERVVNFDLHRRKAFWVDEALAFMLGQTDLDALGRELRVPFPSFALVFTDRHVLSLAERVLSRTPACPAAGLYLHVLTVFITEQRAGEDRVLHLCFACDPLGADLPHLLHHRLALKDATQVGDFLEALAPRPWSEPQVPDADPLRALLLVALNAILYATSAGIEPEERKSPASARRPSRSGAPLRYSSDSVYYLPGAIEISQVRRMKELDRFPSGRTVLRRHMVRGHWRRAAAGWADQRLRWIQPYWKGPDMATVIERTYKLKP